MLLVTTKRRLGSGANGTNQSLDRREGLQYAVVHYKEQYASMLDDQIS